MTAPARTKTRADAHTSSAVGAAALAAVGCGTLAARPALLATSGRPAALLASLFVALFVVGVAVPLPRVGPARRCTRRVALATTVVGVVAFALGRWILAGHAPARLTLAAVAANTLAALAEEVWFRRLGYGLLAPAGPAYAILGTSALFAVVHVSTYGFSVLPLDLAAGAILGWQRAVTGSWTAPACTHALANLFVLL